MTETLAVAILTAFLTLAAGYVLNQLPELKNFPGKGTFVVRLLIGLTASLVILASLSILLGQNDKNVELIARLQGGAFFVGAFCIIDCLQTGLTAWKHHKSGVDAGIDDEKERLKLLKSESKTVQLRQWKNFKYLAPQVVIPVGLQDVPAEVGRSQLIATEDSQDRKAAQPKLLLNLQRFFRLGDRPIMEISTTQRLIDIFDQANLRLLILGKPGAGKTTLLLELAEQLHEEAQQSGCDKIPVIFECSKWKDDNQPLLDWLILQLKDKGVPSGLSRRWIDQRQLVPLLDGLDELGERQQKATNAIAKFITDNDYPAMAVCCRQEEWQQAQAKEPQEKQFGLNGAVYLEPLTDEQIQVYLQQVQRPRLWEHIQSSADLKKLLPNWDTCKKDGEIPGLRSPLLLNMLLVAHKEGQPIHSKSELFQAYIKEQFIRSGKSKYTEAQTRRYLTWLARQLKAEGTTEFEIESLQPSWLKHTWQLWLHQLISGLVYGLVFGLFGGLAFGLFGGLAFRLFGGLAFGLVFGLALIGNHPKIYSSGFSARGIIQSLIGGLVFGIMLGIMLGLIGEAIARVINGVTFGLIDGVTFGLVAGLII
jgi:GTPase SAR1 family protein